jgi:hypothetical protein
MSYEIQEEINMMFVSKVEDVYQAALKAEENWPGNKANETEEEIQVEVREPAEKSSRNQSMKLESSIVTHRKVEILRKDNMDD